MCSKVKSRLAWSLSVGLTVGVAYISPHLPGSDLSFCVRTEW